MDGLKFSDQKFEVITQQEPRWWSHAAVPVEPYISIRQIGAVSELHPRPGKRGTLVSPAREARKTLQIMLGILDSHHGGNVRVEL